MSSVLKALKKLEDEKTGRIPNALKLNLDILKVQDSPRKRSASGLLILALLLFGGGAAVAFYFMKTPKTPQTAVTSTPMVDLQKTQPPVLAPDIKTETPPGEIVVAPSGAVPRIKKQRGLQVQLPPTEDDADTATSAQPVKAAVQTKSEQPHVVVEAKKDPRAATPIPTFRVNGIAYQPNEADSMAIVNGTPVSRGSVIEGATVAEIQKDRILFQRNGEKFEVQLGQSNK